MPGAARQTGRPRADSGRTTGLSSYRWVVLAIAFFGVFGAIGFGRFGYSAILPTMQDDLGITSAAAGSLASWNLGGYMSMAFIGGILAARVGPRIVVTAGLVITAAGMLLTGLSNGLIVASAGRLLTGLGSGTVLVPSIGLMAAWFDTRRLGFASASVSSGAALALVLVGLAIPPIISSGGAEGWRLAWYFFAGIVACLAVLNGIVQRDRPSGAGPRVTKPTAHRTSSGSLRTMAAQSYLDLKTLVRSRYAWHLGLVYLLYGAAFLIYMTFFQKRLTVDLGYSSAVAGYVFLIVGAGGLLGGVLWGSVSDRIGRGRALALMCLMMALASGLFAWGPAMPALVVSAFILGLAGMGFPGVIGAGCGDQFGAVLAPAALGLVTVLTGVGMVIGPYVAGKVADLSGSLIYSYILAACIFVVIALLAVFLRETGRDAACRARRLEDAGGAEA
jgi:sugar phosphate permease